MEWYKRFPHKALEGMLELNLKQRGVYGSLIDLLYARDGQVIDHDVRVARMLRIHWRTYRAIKTELQSLGKLWVGNDGFLKVPRLETTLKNYILTQSSNDPEEKFDAQELKKVNDFNGRHFRSKKKKKNKEEISLKKKSPPPLYQEISECGSLAPRETALASPTTPETPPTPRRRPPAADEALAVLAANIAKYGK
jgi:uncharacterized protein YdaU (DUF1376 family)